MTAVFVLRCDGCGAISKGAAANVSQAVLRQQMERTGWHSRQNHREPRYDWCPVCSPPKGRSS